MARIPIASARRSLDPGSPVNYPGSLGTGEALQGFGNDIARAGQQVQSANDSRAAQESDRFEALFAEATRQREGIENFETEQGFLQTKIATASKLPEIQSSIPASGAGLHDGILSTFDENAEKFLSSVPERLRPKMQTLVQTERMSLSSRAAESELVQRNGWFRTGIEQGIGTAQEQVYNNPAALEAARDEVIRSIEASSLLPEEKEEWKLKARQGVASSLAARVMQDNPEGLVGAVGIAAPQQADGGLIGAMIQTESSGNPNAESPVGASGLLQVMPATGVEIAGELNDPAYPVNGTEAQQKAYLKREDVSVRYGTHYMNKMLARYGGDPQAALIAYNGGAARADAWLKSGRDDSVIPKESADYYKKVLGRVGGAVAAGSPAVQSHIQVAKAFLGAYEGKDSGALSAFIQKATGVNLDPRQTAWCAAWLNAVFQSQGIQGTGKLNARSFLDFGAETDQPTKGDVVVLSRGDPNGWQGHVGIFMGFDGNGNPQVLGGNQGNRVSVQSFSKDKVLGYRRPPSVGNTAEANDRLARLPGGGPSGGLVVTELDPRFADLPFAERLKLSSQAQQAGEQRRVAAETARKAQYTAYKDATELQILTGGITSEEEILSDGALDDGDKSTLLRTFRTQQKEASATGLAVKDYLAGGMADLNPLDGDQRSQANKVYDVLTKNAAEAGPEVQQALERDFIQRTGIIPDPVAATLRKAPYATNPQELTGLLDEAARLDSISPVAFDTMPNGEALRRDLTSYRSMVNDRGMSSEEAARRIIERRSPDAQRNESILGPAADKAVKDLEVTDVTSAMATGILGFGRPGEGADPTTQNALLAEYREAFREEFIRAGGDEDEARAQAVRLLQKTWGESSITGERQVMKYPPERFYPAIDGGHEYLRNDAMATAKEVAGVPEVGNVMLRPDAATAADIRAGRPPRYRLFYERTEGDQTIIDQVPGYWAQPDVEAAAASARSAAIERARAEREEQSYFPSGIDRDETADRYLNMFGVPQPGDRPGQPAPREPFKLPSAPAPMPRLPADPNTAEGINERLQGQRDELFRSSRGAVFDDMSGGGGL